MSEVADPPAAAPAASEPHDVHSIAAEAASIENEIEQFLDEALLSDFRETPLHTMENVLEERRERNDRVERVHARAKELLDEEVSKEKHVRELRELEEAITATNQPISSGGGSSNSKAGAPSAAAPAAEEAAWSAAVATAPVKLEGAGRSKGLKPYMADLSEFVTEGESARNIKDLRAENELLRKCLSGSGENNRGAAFEQYLRRARGGASAV